jgi:uncharacterized protein (TIGR00297 family)
MSSEIARKLVHMAFGFVAILLKWLTTWQAAGMAVAAFLFNLLVLPHVGGRHIARTSRGHDAGILIYPLAVLALILIFPSRPDIAAAIWAIMAFGDGAATLLGKLIGRRKLPWNGEKSWIGFFAFMEAAIVPAYLLYVFVAPFAIPQPRLLIVAITVVACAVAESLRTNIDDNLVVPFTGAAVMFGLNSLLEIPSPEFSRTLAIWLAVNAVLAIAGYLARSVSASGMIGGFVLGSFLIAYGGWPLYVVLLAFFVLATAATKVGYARKASLGLAQEKGGRRGFGHAFANVGLAALIAPLIGHSSLPAAMLFYVAAAALATAAADTAGSEIGQLLGRRAFLPITFRRVDRGTEGAISVEGTLASAAAAIAVAGTAVFSREGFGTDRARLLLIGTVAASAFAGAYLESILGSWNRKRARPIPNGTMNFLNTMFGAAICAALWKAFLA